MNLLRTDENFSRLTPKDKINLVRGLATSRVEEESIPELKFTVLVDQQGNHTLSSTGEVIDLNDWQTIESYLKGKYPLNRISIDEIRVGNFRNNGAGNTKAA